MASSQKAGTVAESRSLAELLAEADETTNAMNTRTLVKMELCSIFVNAAWGGLDGLATEPVDATKPFRARAQVVVPQIAWLTPRRLSVVSGCVWELWLRVKWEFTVTSGGSVGVNHSSGSNSLGRTGGFGGMGGN